MANYDFDNDLNLPSGQPIIMDEKKHIPQGLPDLLEMISREVLRYQPDGRDIAEFLSTFLNKLLGVRDGKAESKNNLTTLPDALPISLQRADCS